MSKVTIEVEVNTPAEKEALDVFLLRGVASERSDMNRLNIRLHAGYGDSHTRDTMDTEEGRARLRYTMGQRMAVAAANALKSHLTNGTD